ncbi:MAG: TRAP transporter fused permease subunit [Pseudomonadota bacterium]
MDEPRQGVRGVTGLTAVLAALITLTAVFWASGAPLWFGWRVYTEQILIVALALTMAIAYLTKPGQWPGLSYVFAVGSLLFGGWLAVRFPTLSENVFYHPTEALIVSAAGFFLIVESVRRTMGWSLIVILACVCGYALFSSHFSGPLQSRSIAPDRLITFLVLDSASLAGAALSIAVAVVVPFLILSQLLLATGGSDFFSDLSMALAGRRRGGAAKIAILGSSFFGSVSGSAVSNVASTGAITIPMMKEGGYRPKTAAAIEAAASTGGQLMPPIMGAAAFLLAENLQATYASVMLAALVPSLLYYFSIFVFADLEAGRRGIERLPESRIPAVLAVLRRGWFVFVPFAVLLVSLFRYNLRPETAALLAILALLVLSVVRTYDGRQVSPRMLINVLIGAGKAAVEVVLICAIAGMIIGLVARSGLSFGLGFFLVQLGQSSLLLLLIVTALVCIVMGMGLPTVGVYLLLASLAAPPLVELGLKPMAAHLFVLYFGMLSMLTPPVAIAAFVAANMAKAPAMATGWEAVRIAWPAYLVPFLFAASPALLLDAPPLQAALIVISALAGVYCVTAAIVGFLGSTLRPAERIVLLIAGAAVLTPHDLVTGAIWANAIGVTVALVLWMGNRPARA